MIASIEGLARLGYAAKGVVYVLIGWLAVQAALGVGGRTTGSRGALLEILSRPFGRVALGVVAVGLAGYALWRFVQCFNDPDREGSSLHGLLVRAGQLASGIAYAALTAAAVAMLTGENRSADEPVRSHTAELMSAPRGRLLVALAGAIALGAAIAQLEGALRERFLRHLELSRLDSRALTWVLWAGLLGNLARAAVFVMVAVFLLLAAYRADPGQARGLGETLLVLEQQRYGPWLLLAAGAGLLLYGLFQLLVVARHRRIAPS